MSEVIIALLFGTVCFFMGAINVFPEQSTLLCYDECKVRAVKLGLGKYDSSTGKFVWNDHKLEELMKDED